MLRDVCKKRVGVRGGYCWSLRLLLLLLVVVFGLSDAPVPAAAASCSTTNHVHQEKDQSLVVNDQYERMRRERIGKKWDLR